MSLNALLVDLASGGSPWKQAVRVSSITNITLSGLQTIDGVALAIGDPVGVFGQTNPAYNGIYVASETAWARRADFDRPEFVQLGSMVTVLEGTTRAGHLFQLSAPTSGEIRVGVTQLTFADRGIPGLGSIVNAPTMDFQSGGDSRIRYDANDVRLNESVSGKVSLCEAGVEYMNFQNISGVPTITVGATNLTLASGSQVILSAGSICQVTSAGFYTNGGTIVDRTAAFATMATRTVAPAYITNYDAACSSVSTTWAQDASAAGGDMLIEGQKGAVGFIGGKVTLRSGRGGTNGTNLGGNVAIDLAPQVTGTTDVFEIMENGTRFLSMRKIGTGSYIEATDLNLNGTNVGLVASANGVFAATSMFFNQTTIYWRTAASAIKCSVSVADTYVENFASGVTVDRQINGASRVFVDSNGTKLTGNERHASAISPTAIGTNQTGYNPSGLVTCRRLRQDVSAACFLNSIRSTGIEDGHRITIENISNTAANTLTLLHDDGATGTAADRFLCPGNANVVIPRNGSAEVEYDLTSARWRVIGKAL